MADRRGDPPSGRWPRWAVLAARLRLPLTGAGAVLLLVSVLADLPARWALLAAVLVVLGFALYLRVGTVHSRPVRVCSPVRGRWVPVNSPADKIPSHGVQAYGQTYAVDLIHVPQGDWTLELGWAAPHSRPPEDYPGFGRSVVAPADGVVVRTRDTRRDHPARTSYLGLGVMLLEGFVLEITGRILGNHVVLDIGSDTYVLVAHLRRGSVQVNPGDRVLTGTVLGECGNSGNTSEPHVHMQVMDRARAGIAAGLPFELLDTVTDDGTPVTVPRNGQAFSASGGPTVDQGPAPPGPTVDQGPAPAGPTVDQGPAPAGPTVDQGPAPAGPTVDQGPAPPGPAVDQGPAPRAQI